MKATSYCLCWFSIDNYGNILCATDKRISTSILKVNSLPHDSHLSIHYGKTYVQVFQLLNLSLNGCHSFITIPQESMHNNFCDLKSHRRTLVDNNSAFVVPNVLDLVFQRVRGRYILKIGFICSKPLLKESPSPLSCPPLIESGP